MRNIVVVIQLLLTSAFIQAQDWNFIVKNVASDRGATGDNYGYFVAISGNYAVVGAPFEDEDAASANTMNNSGAAYILQKENGTWSEVQKIVSSDRAIGDNFGYRVDIDGDYIVIGAWAEDEDAAGANTMGNAGSAYIFKNISGTWTQVQKIAASDRAGADNFGISVGISGDYVVVGAHLEDEDATGNNTCTSAGAAYVFKNVSGTWTQMQKIVADDRSRTDYFGRTIAIDGSYILVGAHQEGSEPITTNVSAKTMEGAAYLFLNTADTWTQVQKLVADDRATNDNFGTSLAIDGDYVVVGAHFEDDEDENYDPDDEFDTDSTVSDVGAAYIFYNTSGTWNQVQKIVAPTRSTGDLFGKGLSISGDIIAVGAIEEDEDELEANTLSGAGAIYIYQNNAGTWSETQKIVPSDRAAGDNFGYILAVENGTVIISAYQEDEDANGLNTIAEAGSVYIYKLAHMWGGTTSSDWNTASNWNSGSVPGAYDNVIISNQVNDPIVNEDPSSPALCYDLDILNGVVFTINAGKSLTVSGNIDNDGTLNLESDATGTATILTGGTVAGSGTYNVEQYVTGAGGGTPSGRTWYITTPLNSAQSSVFSASGGNQLWSHSESTYSFTEITDDVTYLQPMAGYAARLGANTTLTFTGGYLNTGDISNVALSRTGTASGKRGYNLVGNPYPSFLDWEAANKTNLSTSVIYRTATAGGTNVFDTYNGTSHLGTNNNGSGTVTRYLAPMQSFWVYVNADGQTGELAFTNAMRSHQTGLTLPGAVPQEERIRLKISDGTNSDETIIYFTADAQNQFDDYDSKKMMNGSVPQVYTSVGQEELVINGLSDIASNPIVPLTVTIPNNGQYFFNAYELVGFSSGKTVYLEDKTNNTIQDLTLNPVYSFSATKGTSSSRFNLLFEEITTSTQMVSSSKIKVYQSAGDIVVNTGNINTGTLRIYDINGKELLHQTLNSPFTRVHLESAEGVYFVTVQTANETSTEKLVITQ